MDYSTCNEETSVDEEVLNLENRKFLKKVGITSQREIEKAVREALEAGTLKGNERLEVVVTLEIEMLGLKHTLADTIALEK